MRKKIGILGSTGSIGSQSLDIIKLHDEKFEVLWLTAHSNASKLIEQALEYKPNFVVIVDSTQYQKVKEELSHTNIEVKCGKDSLLEAVQIDEVDTIISSMVGFSGLSPTLAAIKAKKNIAIANKETLVVAGEIVMNEVQKNKVTLMTIDSEHAAIHQCLNGERIEEVRHIILTASGGPFRGYSMDQLNNVNVIQALNHPNWKMGNKITIDSATLVNKGLEVIEAKWLFDLKDNQIKVVVHPESIIHSMVEFIDGSLKAQLGLPDMRIPIQYALSYPKRFTFHSEPFSVHNMSALHFEEVDKTVFRSIEFAYYVMKKGGNMPCILNAANEVAVELFLSEKINFLDIYRYLENALDKIDFIESPTEEDLFQTDKETRKLVKQL